MQDKQDAISARRMSAAAAHDTMSAEATKAVQAAGKAVRDLAAANLESQLKEGEMKLRLMRKAARKEYFKVITVVGPLTASGLISQLIWLPMTSAYYGVLHGPQATWQPVSTACMCCR